MRFRRQVSCGYIILMSQKVNELTFASVVSFIIEHFLCLVSCCRSIVGCKSSIVGGMVQVAKCLGGESSRGRNVLG